MVDNILKWTNRKKCVLAIGAMEEANIAILICDKIYDKLKLIRRVKEVPLILIKGIVN